jgi:hypothetical protein
VAERLRHNAGQVGVAGHTLKRRSNATFDSVPTSMVKVFPVPVWP